MYNEVSFELANQFYKDFRWICIGETPENSWHVNRAHHEDKTLADIVDRYKQYYGEPIKYFA